MQKQQKLKPDRPDILIKVREKEVLFGEITGPSQETADLKNKWDLYISPVDVAPITLATSHHLQEATAIRLFLAVAALSFSAPTAPGSLTTIPVILFLSLSLLALDATIRLIQASQNAFIFLPVQPPPS
jgi:hypothetical protein